MTKKFSIAIVAIMALCLTANADPIKIKGVYNNNRYDDHADHWRFLAKNNNLVRVIPITPPSKAFNRLIDKKSNK